MMLRLFRARKQAASATRTPVEVPRLDSRRARLSRAVRKVLASYDAAETNDGNRRHWANANGESADVAMSLERRRRLRNRSRYECMNNSYARGIVNTLANDCIGTGPRLQMMTGNKAIDEAIESAFGDWCSAIGLCDKLLAMRIARVESGEVFAVMQRNPGLESPVQLDLRLIEADQVSTPDLPANDRDRVDGIVFDRFGNPTAYHVLDYHPGDMLSSLGYSAIPAEFVIHYFRADRPGQSRGVPEITPALPLFALLRRYTLATIGAAETAAMFAGILYSEAPPDDESDAVEPMESIELEPNSLLTVPAGHRMEQMKSEQPVTTYGDFKREILNEIARCLNMPFNIAAANSASYNYASGRLDHQGYDYAIRIDRRQIERVVLDRLLSAFLREAILVSDLLPLAVRSLVRSGARLPKHQWFWDSREHVDPSKESAAQEQRLKNNTTTLAAEYARVGRDWEAELRQRAREVELMRKLGLAPDQAPGASPGAAPPASVNPGDSDNAEED
jgi:lambda family phage portal protein